MSTDATRIECRCEKIVGRPGRLCDCAWGCGDEMAALRAQRDAAIAARDEARRAIDAARAVLLPGYEATIVERDRFATEAADLRAFVAMIGRMTLSRQSGDAEEAMNRLIREARALTRPASETQRNEEPKP